MQIQEIDKRGAVLVTSGLGTLGHCFPPCSHSGVASVVFPLGHALGLYETQSEVHL